MSLFEKELPFVLSDVDGTLALADLIIPENTIKSVLNYQKKSGYRFSFITGRNVIVNKKIADELKIQLPIVSCNGALITDNKGKILSVDYLDKTTCVKIFRQAAKEGLDIVAYTPDAIVGTPNSNRVIAWRTYRDKQKPKHQFKITTYPNLDDIATAIADEEFKPVELVCTFENQDQKTRMVELFNQFSDQIDYVQSLAFMTNVLKKGINKGYGLNKWCEIVKTNVPYVVCFGDNYNDIAMLKEVKHGYAVGNAVEALKEVAFKVVESVDNNGVGRQLENIMKNEY
ncbi:Cof-type HAD-IIB family hydrolase [Mesoplasma lactucae]|uniref:Hydrolase n=1 Tax=Mesoplasma lactucae ATCC 49193 TaxID=81460 RepID=A0A291IR77_9MOLU|nr:Cof-type HAD-IIB family hydrolase [Mesoplasma lactucae]ATG97445.1 hydrolase [Mesoplasma lactucae ATCC 49193]ATZ20100.1 HAD family hydrolase [Mesoplasma lactucae ATCC 49193]MCL8216848.1 Pyridoxal phosphate phosphatase YbhA [Mesoplasma lactucae ATCC 49193]